MWTPFEATFGRIQGLVSFEPVYIDYYHQAFLDFAADGVMRLEMRGMYTGNQLDISFVFLPFASPRRFLVNVEVGFFHSYD